MSVRYQKTQKRVAIATLKALWVEFQAYIREENSVRAAFPSVCLVCLCCVRSERLQSRKYSNEWLVSPISFRWMLCQGEVPGQTWGQWAATHWSSWSGHPPQEDPLRTWPVGWKSRSKLLLLGMSVTNTVCSLLLEGCWIYTSAWSTMSHQVLFFFLEQGEVEMIAGDDFLKAKRKLKGEMLQVAWKPFWKLCWSLSECVSLKTYCKAISLKKKI